MIHTGIGRKPAVAHEPVAEFPTNLVRDSKVGINFSRKKRMQMLVAYTNLSGTEAPQVCPVVGLDGRNVQLRVSTPNHIGSAVKIEADDTMSLGEVSHCRPDGDGYVVWVELAQALRHVDELSRLARALLA